jgi:hypothetical protein
MKLNRKLIGAGLATVLVTIPLRASLFDGLVWDIPQELNSAKQILQEIQMVASLKQQYDHLKAQAQQFTNIRQNWKTFAEQIQQNWTPNKYGETANWSGAASGSSDPVQALMQATLPLHANPNYQNETVGNSPVSAAIATANIIDGSSVAALRTIGAARANQAQINQAISSVENLALSESDQDNTEEKSLNLIGAASVQNLRMQQAQQALLVTLAEQSIPINKVWRDATVNQLNSTTERQQRLASSGAFPGSMGTSFASY